MSEKQTGKTQIRLLLQKQSDLGLSCLSRFEKEANILIDYCRLDDDLKEVFTVNVLKFQTVFFVCFQIKCWLLGQELINCLSEKQRGEQM